MTRPYASPELRCRTRSIMRVIRSRGRWLLIRRERLSITVTHRDRLYLRMMTTRAMLPMKSRVR